MAPRSRLIPHWTRLLEASLTAVESGTHALGEALCARDSHAVDSHSSELHRALSHALDQFTHAARHGAMPPGLPSRLVRASGQVAAQRESLARATAALYRAIDVLLPRDNAALYTSWGGSPRAGSRGASDPGLSRAAAASAVPNPTVRYGPNASDLTCEESE